MLTICAAEDVMKADRFGKSDPYCRIFFNDVEIGRTPIVRNTLSPVWDETQTEFILWPVVPPMSEEVLSLHTIVEMPYTLELSGLEAYDLKAELVGYPYVKFTLGTPGDGKGEGGAEGRSEDIEDAHKDCVWEGQTVTLDVTDQLLYKETLKVEIWNDNHPADDTLIAGTTCPLDSLIKRGARDHHTEIIVDNLGEEHPEDMAFADDPYDGSKRGTFHMLVKLFEAPVVATSTDLSIQSGEVLSQVTGSDVPGYDLDNDSVSPMKSLTLGEGEGRDEASTMDGSALVVRSMTKGDDSDAESQASPDRSVTSSMMSGSNPTSPLTIMSAEQNAAMQAEQAAQLQAAALAEQDESAAESKGEGGVAEGAAEAKADEKAAEDPEAGAEETKGTEEAKGEGDMGGDNPQDGVGAADNPQGGDEVEAKVEAKAEAKVEDNAATAAEAEAESEGKGEGEDGAPEAVAAAAMDKNMFRSGGSSDPLVIFRCGYSKATSTTKKKSLNPEWNETFTLETHDMDTEKGILEVEVEDYDLASGNDFMGKALVPLLTFAEAKEAPVRAWYKLGNEDGSTIITPLSAAEGKKALAKNPFAMGRGEVELEVKWVHNPDKVVALSKAVMAGAADDASAGSVLRTREVILIFRSMSARELPETEMGARMFGAKQDPYLKLTLGTGTKAESSYKDGAGKEASWDGEELRLRVVRADLAKLDMGELKVEVWNENAPAPDTLIGKSSVPSEKLVQITKDYPITGQEVLIRLPLSRPKKGEHGVVQMAVSCEDYIDPKEAELPALPEKLQERADDPICVFVTEMECIDLIETEMGARMFGAKQDPYLKFWAFDKDHAVQSSYKDGAGKNASWGDENLALHLPLHDLIHGLHVECWNENAPAPDTFIGDAHYNCLADDAWNELDLEELLHHENETQIDVEFELRTKKGGLAGRVQCKISFEEVTVDDVSSLASAVDNRPIQIWPQLRIEMYDHDDGDADEDDFMGCVVFGGHQLVEECTIVKTEITRGELLKHKHPLRPKADIDKLIPKTRGGFLAMLKDGPEAKVTGKLAIKMSTMTPFKAMDDREAVAAEKDAKDEAARKAKEEAEWAANEEARLEAERKKKEEEELELKRAFARAPIEVADETINLVLENVKKELLNRHLILHVVDALNLRAADVFGKSDPYAVVVWDGKELGRTGVIEQDLNPVWGDREDATFLIPPSTSKNPELRVELYDSDWVSLPGQKDDFLGRAIVSGDELIELRRQTLLRRRRAFDQSDLTSVSTKFFIDENEEEEESNAVDDSLHHASVEEGSAEHEAQEKAKRVWEIRLFNLEASGMPETELGSFFGGKQDPFVKMKLGPSQEARTTTKDGGGSACKWDGEVVSIEAPESMVMRTPCTLEVWNYNFPHKDVLIGQAEIRLDGMIGRDIGEGKAIKRTLKLERPKKKGKHKQKGTLTVHVMCTDVTKQKPVLEEDDEEAARKKTEAEAKLPQLGLAGRVGTDSPSHLLGQHSPAEPLPRNTHTHTHILTSTHQPISITAVFLDIEADKKAKEEEKKAFAAKAAEEIRLKREALLEIQTRETYDMEVRG